MSYSKILIHAVFTTKNRENTLSENRREDLYRFIWKQLQSQNCTLLRIGGIENHIHILFALPLDKPISIVMRDIKRLSSTWIKENNVFPHFISWAEGYCAISCSHSDANRVIDYIKNQKSHHQNTDSKQELISLLDEYGISYKEEYV